MMQDMQDKVALVTGGSSGIGKATALAFAQRGACVAIANRNPHTGEAALREIKAVGGNAIWIQADVTQSDQVQAMVAQMISTYGRLDYAFNNAGSGGNGGFMAQITEEDWDETITIYLKSAWLCMKYELLEMLKAGHGAIVNNASVDGLRGFPWNPAYSAAKHGVVGLTKSAAMQYATKGIRINAVCPGWIRTPPVADMIAHDPEAEQGMLMHQPIGRLGEAKEVAAAVVWLCSEAASLIVGTALPVDGGYTVV
ncbi:MAG: SDR family oxidoreductase [Anaerolineae bacterium]|nr:SDR family oxidoreductase [Anaerolineae bacterium]